MVRANQEEVLEVGPSVAPLHGRSVDGTIEMAGELTHGPGREDIRRGQRGVMGGVNDSRQMGAGDAIEAAAPFLLAGLVFGLG